MRDIVESDWTLGAVKRREEERLRSERAAREGDAETIQTPQAPHVSGDNWVAEAFRRRQAEERAKAERHQSVASDRADAASREVPVDNWLIEGFKRHQEEDRRLEIAARSDGAVAPADGDEHSNSQPMRALVVVDEVSPLEQERSEGRAAGADDQASSGSLGALVTLDGGRALVRRPRSAARRIAIAGVIIVGLVSLFGLKTALWNSGDPPRSSVQETPSAPPSPKVTPPSNKENLRPDSAGPSHGSETTNAPPARPADAPPAKPSDAATIPAPRDEAPQSSTQNPAAPRPHPESKAPSPPAAQGDKSLQDDQAAPAATPVAPVSSPPKEASSPAKPDKDSTAKPASVGTDGSRDEAAPEREQNASEPKRQAPNANIDAKSKPSSKKKRSARRSSRKSDDFSAFLKRTEKSVRRFLGRLGAKP
ncbi:MAG: hypothetical protein AB7U61_05645 [Methylocystis sp.]